LRYLAASPLLTPPLWPQLQQAIAGGEEGELISAVHEAINIFDFHAVARQKLPPAHYGYLATGTLDDATLRANRTAFDKWQLRLRRLAGVKQIDTSVELLGTRWKSPITLAPVGSQEAFHPEGVRAAARAARATDTLQIMSMVSNSTVEDVVEQRGGPVWFQLYPGEDWSITAALLKRVERAGCPAVVLTVDALGSNRETLNRFSKKDTRDCTVCHNRSVPNNGLLRNPMFKGVDLAKVGTLVPLDMTWDFVRRLQDAVSMKLLLKGIVTREDAELAVENRVNGLIVSNHGGRQDPSGRGTIESLPEVVSGVRGRIPVLIDGGFRRGTDIFKALALGANAISIGRPYAWGLAAFGQEGVEAVIRLMRAEFEMVMRQTGTTSLAKITGDYLVR
jgi:isopentenyl diphosphate isomerase/L-lactate dehydrogenase-like FMN-dependent dehydrogenase